MHKEAAFTKANHDGWGSRVGLVLAMAGNAVGLGNFLRFPIQAIQNGGGSFIIPYLVCFLLMGIPLLFVEWSMGRFGGKSGHHSTPFILNAMAPRQKLWKYVGVFGIFTNIAVAAYYCYIESWTMAYVYYSITGAFSGESQESVSAFYDAYISPSNPIGIIFWVVCIWLNTWILSRGLQGGVEKAAKIGMPLLLLFGIFLAIRAVTLEAGENGARFDSVIGLNFLWTPDFSTIWSPTVWLNAAGQIFFTLSVGMGSIQAYASYMRAREDVALNAMSAGWMNEFVEVVLGSAIIIPITVGYFGIDGMISLVNEGGGFGLGFRTLPFLFQSWGPILAAIAGICWFGLLFFAGITSSLAMGTPVASFLRDEFGWRQAPAAYAFGFVVLLLGIPAVLSQLAFNEFDYWAGTVSLVIFALLEIILFAWIFGMKRGWEEITTGADIRVPRIFRYIIQYVTPLFLLVVFVGSLPDIWERISSPQEPMVHAARAMLVLLFVTIAVLVYRAANRPRGTKPFPHEPDETDF